MCSVCDAEGRNILDCFAMAELVKNNNTEFENKHDLVISVQGNDENGQSITVLTYIVDAAGAHHMSFDDNYWPGSLHLSNVFEAIVEHSEYS